MTAPPVIAGLRLANIGGSQNVTSVLRDSESIICKRRFFAIARQISRTRCFEEQQKRTVFRELLSVFVIVLLDSPHDGAVRVLLSGSWKTTRRDAVPERSLPRPPIRKT
jgi:hypothetical protein